jgi:N4-gp56 family major capsid protein
MRFFQFARIKTELGIEPGLSINMLTYDNLSRGGSLTEGTKIQKKAMSGSMKAITVGEKGNAVSVSELLLQSSFDDVMASATTLLARDYALVLDIELRDTALAGTNVIYARKKDGTKITQRTDLIDECTFKVSSVKDAIEILATNNAPKAMGGANWICFVHPHASRDLRDDPAWINASNYADPSRMLLGEIGRIDDTIFIETSIMPNGDVAVEEDPAYDLDLIGGGSGTTNVYKAVLFGEGFYAIAFSLPVELRDDGVQDFGREHSLAWYAIWGTGRLNNDYGVVIEHS